MFVKRYGSLLMLTTKKHVHVCVLKAVSRWMLTRKSVHVCLLKDTSLWMLTGNIYRYAYRKLPLIRAEICGSLTKNRLRLLRLIKNMYICLKLPL